MLMPGDPPAQPFCLLPPCGSDSTLYCSRMVRAVALPPHCGCDRSAFFTPNLHFPNLRQKFTCGTLLEPATDDGGTDYEGSCMVTADLFTQEALPHLNALYNYALRLCKDEQRTQDLVQDTMLKAYRFFHTYTAGTNCRAWLFQICRNLFINLYRSKQHQPIVFHFQEDVPGVDDFPEASIASPGVHDETDIETQQATFGDEVVLALEGLPQDFRTAVILSDIEGHSYEEIASFTHVPVGTVRSRIHRGRKMLTASLGEYARRQGFLHRTVAA